MTNNIQAEKIDLIKIIASTDDSDLLHRIREVVEDTAHGLSGLVEEPAMQIDVEQLKSEQDYVTEDVAALHGQWFTDDDYFELLQMLDG